MRRPSRSVAGCRRKHHQFYGPHGNRFAKCFFLRVTVLLGGYMACLAALLVLIPLHTGGPGNHRTSRLPYLYGYLKLVENGMLLSATKLMPPEASVDSTTFINPTSYNPLRPSPTLVNGVMESQQLATATRVEVLRKQTTTLRSKHSAGTLDCFLQKTGQPSESGFTSPLRNQHPTRLWRPWHVM